MFRSPPVLRSASPAYPQFSIPELLLLRPDMALLQRRRFFAG
jgi:hypothetical protein